MYIIFYDSKWKYIYFLSAKFNERWPFPTGVIRGPFNPILLVFTDSIALDGIFIVPSGAFTGVTSTTSHSIGVYKQKNLVLIMTAINRFSA